MHNLCKKKKQNCGVDKLFDNNSGTYWSANFENNETIQSYVNIVFAKDSTIESILMDTADRTRDVENIKVRYYDGFPTTFDVYSAGCNDLTFMHQATFKEEPEYPISLKISYYM